MKEALVEEGRLKISTLKSLCFCCFDVFSFCKAKQETLFSQSFMGNSAGPLPWSLGFWQSGVKDTDPKAQRAEEVREEPSFTRNPCRV